MTTRITRRHHATPTKVFSGLDELKAWIARSTSIPAHQVVALTSQGRAVKLQTLHQETEIYVYDIRISSPTSPGGPSPKSEVPLPKRYTVPNAPNYIGDIRVLSEWQALYKERQAWALGIVGDSARLAAEVQDRYGEMDVMIKCLDAAVTNLEISVKQIDPKYTELKKWVEPSMGEFEQLAESWERCLEVARSVPISAAMVRFMTSRDLKKKQATLEDLIDLDTARKSGKLAPTLLKKFSAKAADLDKTADKMYAGVERLFGEFDNLVGRSSLARSGEAAQLLQDIEAVAKKIETDYSTMLEYADTQANVLQASRTAENHTSRLIPSLKKRAAEMADMLHYATEARNTIAADSIDFMRNITEITSMHSSVKNQITVLNQAEDVMTTFDYLRLINQLPYMYASFASEAIRRREWSDKIKTDSSTLANEMALFQDEESKRRRKWHKMVGSMYGRDNLEANILGLEVNLLGEEEPWPSMVKRDLEEFLEHLQRQQAEVAIIEDVTKLVNELSNPTKQQSKRLKAFKNGSVHEAALGRSGLMIRGDDDLNHTLRDDNTKLQNKLKTAESRVRRLEDLLHRQSQASSRPGIGGLFGHERNDSTNSVRSVPPEDSRRAAGNSEALLQKIQQLENELNAEKEKAAAFEKDLTARTTEHNEVLGRVDEAKSQVEAARAQMEEANATKKELLENMEALQKEFVIERKSFENEIKGLKARLEETEDDIENFGESRENEKATYIERMHEMEAEIDRLQKDQKDDSLKTQGQVDFLRNEARLQREQNEALEKQLQTANDEAKKLTKSLGSAQETVDTQLKALRDIHDQLSPNDDTTEDLNDLIEALVYKATDVAAKLKTLDNDKSILKADLEQAEEHVKSLKTEIAETKEKLAAEEETSRHLKENLDGEKARVAALEQEAAESREQLDQLRAKIADGETGSESLRKKLDEEEERITSIKEELASRQSQVGSLEEELRLYKEKLQASQAKLTTVTGHFDTRSEKTKDLTQRLYSHNDRLCRLLERLGFSVTRQESTMTIQKVPRSERGTMSQIHNANDSSDPSQSTIRRSGMLTSRTLADSTDLDLLYWMNGSDADVESEKYEAFMTKLGSFDMDLFAETVYRRVKDVEHLARKLQRDARAYREKAHTLQRDSHEKIAFKHFKEGDLALFLPTRNQTAGAWAAFNVGFPHYFLRETDAHRLRSREWLVARITRIQERVVDLSKSLTRPAETDSVNGEDDDNPFQLSDGLRWYLIDAHEDKPGAPATPGLGKSTIATNNVEAMADMHTHAQANGKDKHRISVNSIEGVSKALNRSLESRRSSSNSKKAIPFAVGAGGAALLKGNALGSETNSLRAVAPETPTGTSPPQGGLAGPSSNGQDQGQASASSPQTEGPSEERPRSPEMSRESSSPTKRSVVWDSLWSVDLSFESGGVSPTKRRSSLNNNPPDWLPPEAEINISEIDIIPGDVPQKRVIEANKRVLSAIHTIAGIRRPDVAQLARDRPRKGKTWLPTYHMVFDAKKREDEDIFDDLACYGFEAKPHFMHPEDKTDDSKGNLEYKFWAGPTPKNENSLWYALALLVEHNPTKAKNIKCLAAKWFFDMTYEHPNTGAHHAVRRAKRFRMYSQLLADSARCADPDDEEIWGKMSMFRALCSNRPDAGMPKEAGYHEMLHMLADFFHTEIITFTRPNRKNFKLRDHDIKDIDTQTFDAEFVYEMRVYGETPQGSDPTFGFRKRKQILLVTDSCLRYFQPVMRVVPTTYKEDEIDESVLPVHLDTTAFDKWERHSPMPWWPGFQRNADNTGWTGDWDDPQLRPGLRLYPASSVFDPPAILHTLSPWSPAIGLQLLQSPYEVMKNLSGGLWPPWKPWFEGDEDCDLWNMIQPEGLRLSWRHPEALPQERPDRRIALSDNRARIGPKTPKYTSKRRLELVDGVKEAFLDKPNMGESEIGWMKVVTTEDESREPYWHRAKRRRT
ncbi:Autophagy-related protein 11 [Colletotrichum sp. SAR 10_66]|nr:Autophagy-related protein 11 [Colletotrichum sp. SAR 10_66]